MYPQLLHSGVNRRQLLATSASALAVGVAGCSGGGGGGSGDLTIESIEEWPPSDYEDSINVWNWYTRWRDEVLEEFTDEYSGIENTTVDAYNQPGQFYSQVQGSHSIDNIGSTGEFSEKMMDEDLISPLPTDLMPAWDKVSDRYKSITEETYSKNGDVYALPTTALIIPCLQYNEDYFDSPPNSFDIFWNEEFADQIAMWDRDYILMQIAALYTGQDPHDPDDMDEIQEVLIQQKDLNRTYYQDHDTVQQLFASEDVVVGATPHSSATQTRAELNDSITYTVPKEGTLVSVDQLVVPSEAPNPVAGAMFTDFGLSDASAKLYWEQAYSPVTTDNAFDLIDEYEDDEDIAETARFEDDWDLIVREPLSDEVREKVSDMYTEVQAA